MVRDTVLGDLSIRLNQGEHWAPVAANKIEAESGLVLNWMCHSLEEDVNQLALFPWSN